MTNYLKQALIAGTAAGALFAGFAVAPALMADRADAREIQVQAPAGAPMSFADLVERVSPAVVSIEVVAKVDGPSARGTPFEGNPEAEEFFRRFFGEREQGEGEEEEPAPAPKGRKREAQALGSGFFISESGHVVTNAHVVENATKITLTLKDEREIEAEIVGIDETTDLAVLKAKSGAPFDFVSFDRKHQVRVGDWVIAVGNPFGLGGTATAGIVSADGRQLPRGSSYTDFIQIDASINRGNSGGPTFDLYGRVIGVNTQILSPSGGSIGIGFAIPSDLAARITDSLIKNGKVERGWIGVTIQDVSEDIAKSVGLPNAKGAIIASVVKDGPAAKSGVKSGDVVLSIDGTKVEDSRDLTRRVAQVEADKVAKLEVLRDGKRQTIDVRMGRRPSEDELARMGRAEAGDQADDGTSTGNLFGLGVRPMTETDRAAGKVRAASGLVITSVEEGSDAERKGLSRGDVIVEASGKPVASLAELEAARVAAEKAGRDALLLKVETRGQDRFVGLKLKGK